MRKSSVCSTGAGGKNEDLFSDRFQVLVMDPLASPLVLTKLRMPAARLSLIPRPRLVELLAPERGSGFILVSAPAGYGKTTLLAEWAQSLLRNEVAVAWYALDPSDDDPIPFSTYLVASLIQALGPIPELAHLAQLLRSSPQVDLQRILQSILNAALTSDQDCVLILDDYHLITSPAIHSALAYLLEHRPENLRLAIGSRSDPPLPLARLRARGQLLEIRTASLRFTAGETGLFLNKGMQLELPLDLLAALEARTEGWAAGLQLAAIAMKSPLSLPSRPGKESFISKEDFMSSFTGSHRYLVEYLLEEVFRSQPESVQAFLLSTSILERMCAPLCDAILGDTSLVPPSGSEAILAHLDQANLFVVALDDQGYWYRYHHLFRDFLHARLLKTQPERVRSLHIAASEWLAAHALLREAAQQALQTRDWDYAAAFVEQHSFTMILHSEISTIYEWCSAFPEEVMGMHPLLCIHQGLALAYSFRRQNQARVEARLQQAGRLIAEMEDGQVVRELTEFTSVVRTFLAFAPDPAADPRELLAFAQRMLSPYSEGEPGQFSGLLIAGYGYMALHEAQSAEQAFETARQIALRERLYFGIVESTFHLARLAHNQGRLRHAAEICRQGQAEITALLAHPKQELPALGCLDIALGCVLLEQDRLDQAEQHLLHGLDLMGGGMNPYYLMTAYVALFRLREVQGRPEAALAALASLEEIWPDIAFCTRGLRVAHALRRAARVPLEDPGMLAEAAAWCLDFSSWMGDDLPPPGMGPCGAAEACYLAYLAWARVQIATGSAQAARRSLAQPLALAQAHGLTTRVIELSLLEAQARRAEGDKQRTWVALERALAAAQPEGYIRIFDQGPALILLLVESAQRSAFTEYIERILAAIGMPGGLDLEREGTAVRSTLTPHGEIFSERELEVLRLMARGATNQEIAEQLVITVGTVKSHINHILGKLAAHNRTEAVARARSLGWLEI